MLTYTPSTLSLRRAVAAHSARADRAVPEWMTDAWKHRVEAEARHGLKSEIRGVSTHR